MTLQPTSAVLLTMRENDLVAEDLAERIGLVVCCLALLSTEKSAARVIGSGALPILAQTTSGLDESGRPVSSGVYLHKMTAGSRVETQRMTLLK